MSSSGPPGAARGAADSRATPRRPARAPPPRGTLRPAPGAAPPAAPGGCCRTSAHTLSDTNTIQHELEIVHAWQGRQAPAWIRVRRPSRTPGITLLRGDRPAAPATPGRRLPMDAPTVEPYGTEHIGSMHVQMGTRLVSSAAKRLGCRMACKTRQPVRARLRLRTGSGSVGVGPCSHRGVDRMAGPTRWARRSRRARPGRLAPVGTARGTGSPAKARALAPASRSRNPGLRTRCRIRAARPRS